MTDLKTYENVLVSGVSHNFSIYRYERIPCRLFADWTALVHKIAIVVHPQFTLPPFPNFFEFTTESIPSDGPYGSSENFYYLDYVYFLLKGKDDYGIKIDFENFRQEHPAPINLETVGFSRGVSSHIDKESTSPLATFYVWHDEDKASEIMETFARHRAYCLSSTNYL